MERQTRVLILVSCYLPGFKGGGPIRSIENLVGCLGGNISFRVVTADRDLHDLTPYPGIRVHEWVTVGKSPVCYLRPGLRGLFAMLRLLQREEYDLIYLNSTFHRFYTIAPLLLWRLKFIPDVPVVVASRGELSRAALQIKKVKKHLFRFAVNHVFTIFRGVVWQASTVHEETEIRTFLRDSPTVRKVPVLVAQDVVDQTVSSVAFPGRAKVPGKLDLIFLSRIVPKKNLLYAIKLLRRLRGAATLRIFGPVEDPQYWEDCKKEIASLPENIRILYGGLVEHSEVPALMASSHAFLFPTLNENFGHVVFEALSQGCIAVISDTTAWRDLAVAGAGWDIPLDRPDLYRQALQQLMDMDHETFRVASEKAVLAAKFRSDNADAIHQNYMLFNQAKSTTPPKLLSTTGQGCPPSWSGL